jgi:hypothetical protein
MVIIIGCDDFNGPDRLPANAFKDNDLTKEYEEKAKNLLKGELKRRGTTYAVLVEKLAVLGIKENERNLANKISRGGFTAAFLMQCLDAIGCRTIQISD